MLPTFVIGLREGLEAALIVGIIAAFLRKQGRRDLLRWVLGGVALAIGLCVAGGIALQQYSQNLPQRQQEGLETIIGVLAVGMVTYMVVWMRRNSRNLKGQLEGMAADALGGRSGAGRAMVLMAFLAVIREGVETVVFLLAAFNEASSPRSAGLGVVLGILVAVALGYGIYRGGVRINLSRFFRATGFVLVLVAAGIVVNALHTAHEAGWLDAGQGGTVDLSWLVAPGTVQASVLTGMLGVQAHPVVAEVLGWLLYLIPVGLYVTWPPGRPVPTRLLVRVGAATAVVAAAAAVVLLAVRPGEPARHATTAGAVSAQLVRRDGDAVLVRTAGVGGPGTHVFGLTSTGAERHAGVEAERYVGTAADAAAGARPPSLSVDQVARLNGGRLPFGATRTAVGRIAVTYRSSATLTVWIDRHGDRVLDLQRTATVRVSARTAGAEQVLALPYATAQQQLSAAAVRDAARAARRDDSALQRRSTLTAAAGWAAVLAALAAVVALIAGAARRRRPAVTAATARPAAELVRG